MQLKNHHLQVRLAQSEADLRAAERLRYDVFVAELGGDGPLVDHEARFERDAFDPFYDHLILVDAEADERDMAHVVGVYRLLTSDRALETGKFYSEDEFDLSVLKGSGRRLLELGRSCVRRDHRGGLALQTIWRGLADYVLEREIDILFGVASLHGTDVDALALPLAHLHHAHLAPSDLRVRALEHVYQRMDLVPPEQIDRVAAMGAVPPLIKSYLRLGGFVGDGAFVDHAFNTTDVCLVMDTARISDEAKARYVSERAS
ncbi:MAG: GNAT family N-acyltransferase [Paracoccaceae bacterium]|nr:GNAT family N-acyltransferase [Paracoccaceae bacterium]